jgi:hypothetical protein
LDERLERVENGGIDGPGSSMARCHAVQNPVRT